MAVPILIPTSCILQLEDIEHRRTTVKSPQTNGFVERFHRTLLDEHFRYRGAQESGMSRLTNIQKDLDGFLVEHNEKHPRQGRNVNGMTPLAAFRRAWNHGLTRRGQKKRKQPNHHALAGATVG